MRRRVKMNMYTKHEGTQAASKSEHCSDSTPLNRNLFGLREGTQVNPNIVRIAPRLTEICSVSMKARK